MTTGTWEHRTRPDGTREERHVTPWQPAHHRVTRTVPLPWTAPPLSMNDRGASRGAVHAKAATTLRVRTATMQAVQATHPRITGADHLTVQLHYRPRDNRRRDTDNLVATLKPVCDALTAGTRTHPGLGLVPDDIPRYMSKPEPVIHPATKGQPGALWVVLTYATRADTTEEAA